jgi:hypothetical protein
MSSDEASGSMRMKKEKSLAVTARSSNGGRETTRCWWRSDGVRESSGSEMRVATRDSRSRVKASGVGSPDEYPDVEESVSSGEI